MYLESPTSVGSSMRKIAVMVNKELLHITTTVYNAATVHIHQLIVPSSCHRDQKNWNTVVASESITEEKL